jgi:branched-chain amino acid transport system substrate-binding protein
MVKIQKLGKFTSTFFLTFIAAVLLNACTAKAPPEAETIPEIKIGVIVYKNEDIERSSTVNAADMAVEEVNAGTGLTIQGQKYKVTWIREDVRAGVPEDSVTAVQRLINQHDVVTVIGPQYSSDAIPAGEIAEISGIPLISPISTNPRTTLNRKFVFRMGFLDEFQGRIAAIFIRSELQARRAAVVYNVADPYSRELAKVFKEQLEGMDGQVVAFESYTTDEDDLSGQLLRVREKEPEVLYLPNFSHETVGIAIKAREMRIDAILLGGDGWDRTAFSRMPEFEGSYMTAHYSDQIRSKKNGEFVDRYREKYHLKPGDTTALTYDAFHLVFASIKHQDSAAPGSIRDGLYAMGPYEGVGGYIDFEDNGDPVKGVVILQLKDGAPHFVDIVSGE